MSEDLNQPRSGNASLSSPRVEVEPSQPAQAEAHSSYQSTEHQSSQSTSSIPSSAPASGMSEFSFSQGSPYASPNAGGSSASSASQAEEQTPSSHSDMSQDIPYVPSTASSPSETLRHTVVKTRTKKLPVFLASLAGFVLGGILIIALVMSGVFRISDTNVEASDTSSAASQTITIDPEDTTLAETVAAKALPSVVSITAITSDASGSIGSGVILDTEGNILTNYHVVEGATSLSVSTSDGTSYEATLVGSDESSDLAVICLVDVAADELTPIEIGDSDELAVGEWVMAIGSPFGNEASVSTGIVSALYRSTALPSTSGTSIYANMIQTDAAINPGNSGGALVNDEGKLIGINSVIESYSGSSSGVGFAIPVNYAKNIADQIIAGETPVHAYLGVTLSSVTASNALQNNLSVSSGAYVSSVAEGSPAASAGVQEGDIIVAVDSEEVSSADGLIIAIREHNVGDVVSLTLNRSGEIKTLDVTLGSDEALQNSEAEDSSSDSGSGLSEEEFLEYLEELLGRNGTSNQGQGNNNGGF